MSEDPETGDIWLGDVGSSVEEEINRIVKGGNYQWELQRGKANIFPNQFTKG